MGEPRSPYDRGWHEPDGQTEQDATEKPGGGFRHTLAATQDHSLTIDVQAGPFSWTLDEPQALGGRGSAPDPVTARFSLGVKSGLRRFRIGEQRVGSGVRLGWSGCR